MVTSVIFILISCSFCESTTLSNWTKTNVTLSNSYYGRACGYYNDSEEIIMLGGYDNSYNWNKDVMSYSITNDNIQSLSQLPTNVGCMGRCYTQYKEKLYFIVSKQFGIYNTELKQTTYPLSTKQVDVHGFRTCIAISDDKYIFVVGGESHIDDTKTNKFQIYDIEQDIVFDGADMTSIRSSLNCAVSNNYLYAVGGDMGPRGVDTIEKIYIGNMQNIASETWQLLDSKIHSPAGFNHHECIAYNEYIYIIGGSTGSVLSSVITLNTATDTLFEDTSLPIAMYDICGVITDDKRIFVTDTESVYWTQIQTNYPTMDPTNYPTNDPTNNEPTVYPTKQQTLNPTLQSVKGTYPSAESTGNDILDLLSTNYIGDTAADDSKAMSNLLMYIGIIVNVLLFISCISAAIMFLKYYRTKQWDVRQQIVNKRVISTSISNIVEDTEPNAIHKTKSGSTTNVNGYDDNIDDVNAGEYDMEYIGDNAYIVNGDNITKDVSMDGEQHAEIGNITAKESHNMNIANDEFIIKGYDDDDDETKGNTMP